MKTNQRDTKGKFIPKALAVESKSLWEQVIELRNEIYAGYNDEDKIEQLYRKIHPVLEFISSKKRMRLYILCVDEQEVLNNLKLTSTGDGRL